MYIVTGGAGFIGSAVVWKLNRMGVSDILVVDVLGADDKWKNLRSLRFTDYMHRDEFLRLLRESGLPASVTAVVHMGACSSTTERDADFLLCNNLMYSQELCRAALERGARFINASSAATYGDGTQGFSDDPEDLHRLVPLNAYAWSKHLFDLWLARENLLGHVASLKFFNVYGPNEYHKGDMRSMICKGREEIKATGRLRLFASGNPKLPDGGQTRDFVYVKDCAELIWWFLSTGPRGGIFNAGTGIDRSWNDLARALFSALELEPAVDYVPMPEALQGRYQEYTRADTSRLERLACPVCFRALEEGVREYVQNYLETPDPYLGGPKSADVLCSGQTS